MRKLIVSVLIVTAVFCAAARAETPPPKISITPTNAGMLELVVSNNVAGNTYHIEQLADLETNDWQDVHCFEGASTNTHWNPTFTNSAGFFRVLAETNHIKVGQTAPFTTHYHGVSGTAHIVDNCTIELRNFNYDGGGIDVPVIVSPNASFSPYTAISGDIHGTNYSNATLEFHLPESVDLDDVSYISIWCVDVSISFGDGMFE